DHGLPENPGRTSIDALFLSAAKQFGRRTLGVVLAGVGHDGLFGSQLIREIGGHLIVQDTQNARFGGLPRILAEDGIANSVLPLREIPGEVVRMVDSEIENVDSEIPAIAGYIFN
ncbi:MAG: chemotaxis protein CheB, partial [Planctomycetes bacterium]|nr:chemotaxis protein CheB [Planctomycetota bacterium]